MHPKTVLQGCGACACFQRRVTPSKRCAVMQESVPGWSNLWQMWQMYDVSDVSDVFDVSFKVVLFLGSESQPVPFQKVSTHWIRRFLPCLVAVHVVACEVLTMSAPWLRSSSPGVQNTVWCLTARIPTGLASFCVCFQKVERLKPIFLSRENCVCFQKVERKMDEHGFPMLLFLG